MEQLCSFMARAIAPQAPVSAVPVVKPLEWSETRDPTEEIRYTHVIAETPFGIYSIEWKAWRDNDPPCVYLNGDYVECCHNLDAAKNAAKTQLEQRILSALSPQPVTKPAMSGGAHQQSFDEVVENCLRIWFFNYDETADNSAYRVAMREIVKFVRSVSIEPTDRGAHVVRLTADQICQTPLIEELIPNDEEWALCECRQDVYDLMKKCVRRMFKVEEYASQQRSSALASPPPPAQADDGKDAEIEHLKLEMDGVDNAKEEIGRLLGLTEEFRWKRISAAIHEQKRLIRELVAALEPFSVEADTYEPDTGDSRDRVWNCDLTIGSLRSARAALAKAKAAGDPVRTEGEQK
jgi:hypothetical protein